MERLLNIDRPEGFPLCAETLKVLNENGEMFSEWLKGIPLKNRQAVLFGNHLLVCQNLQKRWVEKGVVSAVSMSQCKLVFHAAVSHPVEDSAGNTIADVWVTERADIVDETTPGAQWTILGLQDVFETKLWYDGLPSFVSFLSEASVSSGSFISATELYGQGNVIRSNHERLQMRFAIEYNIRGTLDTVLSIPVPFECPDGTRVDADLEVASTGVHYPVRAYLGDGMLNIDIGRWLKDDIDWHPTHSGDWKQCHDIVRINKEVIL